MMKICLVNVSDVDEAMRSRLRVWRNSEKVSPFFLLDQVTEEQHRAWLERNVRGEDARACVIYADRVPLGLVYLPWFDRNTRCGEIGIYLYDGIQGTAPGFRRICRDDGAGRRGAGPGTVICPDFGGQCGFRAFS